jgi:hypothetical protein
VGVKGADAGQNREAIPQIVRHDGTDHPSPLIADKRMTTNRRQTGSSKRLEEQTRRPSLEFVAASVIGAPYRDDSITVSSESIVGTAPVAQVTPGSRLGRGAPDPHRPGVASSKLLDERAAVIAGVVMSDV